MKTAAIFLCLVMFLASAPAQQLNRPQDVAGIPVNYDEEKVGTYTLPDLLLSSDGKRITNSKEWIKKRRPEILKLVEETQFGKMPLAPKNMRFDVFDKGTQVFNGKAIRKQVTIYFDRNDSEHKMTLLIYLPANAKIKSPLLLNISFVAANQTVEDSGIKVGEIWNREGKKIKADQKSPFGKINVEQFINAGFGFATVYYGDIEPDFKDGIKFGIRGKRLKNGQNQPANDEWGAISAWAWGLSRAMDYFEKDKQIDAKRIAVQGASRLGKTVLWTGIHDQRFKMVIASISGEGGAALARRNYGETVAHITDPTRYYYQFAPNYHSYSNRLSELPIDAHFLVALMAPHPLLLQTGSTDYWSDPKGEFLSAIEATKVYKLFGETGVETMELPKPNDPSLLLNKLGYFMHDGGHSVLSEDWKHFIEYMKKYL